jgi:hypothetical protein
MASLIDTGEPGDGFEEGMRKAEEAAGVPSDAELYGEAFITPAADEAGRIPASRGEDIVEDVPAEEPAEEEAPTEEEPVTAPPVENEELADLKRKVGQMANENAELRRWQEEQMYAQQSQPAPQIDGQAMAWFDEIVDQAPDQAAVWAAQQQQPLLYERAIRSWFDVDPVAAQRYERSMEWNQLQQQMQAQIAPQVQGAQELTQRADLEAAMKTVHSRHDDFEQVVGGLDTERMQQIVESEFPTEILVGLTGTQKDKEKVLETLYRWAKSEQTPALVQGAVQAVESSREESRQAKRQASVASSTVSTPEPVDEDEGARLSRVWAEQRPNMRDAWTGRDSVR